MEMNALWTLRVVSKLLIKIFSIVADLSLKIRKVCHCAG